MSTKKTNETRVVTVCCSVRSRYKEAITKYVEKEDSGSVASVMGKILEKWVEDNKLLGLAEPTASVIFDLTDD
jgi:hypothetical protein